MSTKISALPPQTAPDGADQLPVNDVSASTTKKMTLTVLKEWFQSIAGFVVTAMLADSSVTTAKLANSSVDSTKVDWAAGTGKIWWEELGRTTLSSAGDTITLSSLPAKTYLTIIIRVLATGGTAIPTVRFNNDSGNNYAFRFSNNGGADSVTASNSSIGSLTVASGQQMESIFDGFNILGNEKIFYVRQNVGAATGAATAPDRLELAGKWVNTAAQISRVDVINSGTGDFGIGSEIIVLGHN